MSSVLNFIWINLEFANETNGKDAPLAPPMPSAYLAGAMAAADHNADMTVRLWIDGKRMTGAQKDFLKNEIATGGSKLQLVDLRGIPAYDRESLYNWRETNLRWRDDKKSLIWRQVDAAKVLVCLQGGFDRVYFADMDLAATPLHEDTFQKKIDTYGLFVNQSPSYPVIENQMWGFDAARRMDFFETLYKRTLKEAYKGENGWQPLVQHVEEKLCASQTRGGEGLWLNDIVVFTRESGLRAYHPDHRFETGTKKDDVDDILPRGRLQKSFSGLRARTIHTAYRAVQKPYRYLHMLRR